MKSQSIEEEFDFLFKIIIIGDTGTGKTNLLCRYAHDTFTIDSKPTIGVEFAVKTVRVENTVIKAQIWDTAGQDRYRSIVQAYYKGAFGALVVYDITNENTYNNIDRWLQELSDNGEQDVVIMLCGNKSDLEDQRAVRLETGQLFAKQHNIAFLETSALNASNVEDAFVKLVSRIYEIKKTTDQTFNVHNHDSEKINDYKSLRTLELSDIKQQPAKKGCC